MAESTGGTVTVLTMGPEDAADAVKRALQMGAGKGVHVCDEAIAGSDAVATSLVRYGEVAAEQGVIAGAVVVGGEAESGGPAPADPDNHREAAPSA